MPRRSLAANHVRTAAFNSGRRDTRKNSCTNHGTKNAMAFLVPWRLTATRSLLRRLGGGGLLRHPERRVLVASLLRDVALDRIEPESLRFGVDDALEHQLLQRH